MMKSSIITFVVLFSCICAQAQKLNLDKFEVKSNDITARTHLRQDINGNDCALVKVQLAAPNAIFDGNVIGDVTYNTSEYLVYMSQGSKRMTIKLEGYLPLEVNFEDYNIKALEAKTVYVMTISGVSASNPIEPVRTKTGWIILNSEPSGATVYINDEFVGNTPLTNYKQAYGTYNYRIEHPNYHPSTGSIELYSGKTEKTITLKPAFGAIAITSSVSGAIVLLDGKATNKVTPCTLEEVPSGQHTIIIQKDKYSPRQQNVTVEDGQTAKVSITLDARFAQVSISSLDGAQIYCNGEYKGTTRYIGDLMEGYYDVEVRLAHHKSITKQIQVIAGQSQDISLNPTPIYGSLDVTSNPHDADVTIDGKLYGKTPLTIEQLLEGQHQVKISKAQYAPESRAIIISEDMNASINVTLNPKKTEELPPVNNSKNEVRSGKSISSQDKLSNTAWFVFGTKRELKEQHVLDESDKLRSDFRKEYFTKIDIRIDKEIKLFCRQAAEILTNHPINSYTLQLDDRNEYVLRISDPQAFWSTSKYLVVMVK